MYNDLDLEEVNSMLKVAYSSEDWEYVVDVINLISKVIIENEYIENIEEWN